MAKKTETENKEKGKVVYVKPVLTYDQVLEIIDERITVLERESEKKANQK